MSVPEVFVKEDSFVFETVVRVRSKELDSGQYLSLSSLTALLDEAKSRFFYSKHIKDIDENYQGLIAVDYAVNFPARVRAREELLIEVGVPSITTEAATINFKVSRMHNHSLVGKAVVSMVNFDYRKSETVDISDKTISILEQKPFEL